MRILCRMALTVGLTVVLAGSASAQRQPQQGRGGFGGGGFGVLVRNEAVQKELKMEKDQVDKAAESVKKITDKHADKYAKLRDLAAEERRTKTQELTKTVNEETLKSIGEVLKPEQLTRLKQIELQRAGFAAYTRTEVQTSLKLSDEQKEKVKTLTDDANKQMRELMGTAPGASGTRPPRGQGGAAGRGGANNEKVTVLRKETTEKIQTILSDDQKKSWKELTGAAVEVPPQRPAAPKKDD